MSAIIIDIDSYKEKIDGYDPSKSDLYHQESAKLANKAYEERLKSGEFKNLILVCGGSASGKTEFVDWILKDYENTIIFDSTLSSFAGAVNKIRPALKLKLQIIIVIILPISIESSYLAYLKRQRQFPVEHFIRTHCGARKCFLELFNKYCLNDLFEFRIYSKLDNITKIQYTRIGGSNDQVLKLIQSFQKSEAEIIKIIKNVKYE